jgi:hypothetical protein
MKTIEITVKQKVTYSQQIEVTDEEYELLKEYEGTDVYNDASDRGVYNILNDKIDFGDILESDDLFEDLEIKEVEA